jgi:endo-1,4-beta-xylanase
MVAITRLALGLSAAAGALAAPAEYGPANEERGTDTDFVLGSDHPLMVARRAANLTMLLGRSNTDYTQRYTTGGNVNFNPGTNQFSLSYSVQQDFVVGVGWQTGGKVPVSHTGSFTTTSGLGSLGIYG